MNIANRILQLCEQRSISINKLAILSDITQSTLADIVKGKNVSPRISTIEKICNGLNISIAEFFTLKSDIIASNNEDKVFLPEHIQKEIDLVKEFILYKHGIKKTPPE